MGAEPMALNDDDCSSNRQCHWLGDLLKSNKVFVFAMRVTCIASDDWRSILPTGNLVTPSPFGQQRDLQELFYCSKSSPIIA